MTTTQLPNESLQFILQSRQQLLVLVKAAVEDPEVFSLPDDSLLWSRAQREESLNQWKSMLDCYFALNSTARHYREWYLVKNPAQRRIQFSLYFVVMAAQYRFAMEFLHHAADSPDLDKLLNQPMPELGLPAQTWADFKYHYLNVAKAAEFAALKAAEKMIGIEDWPELENVLREDCAVIWEMGRGSGEIMTAKNAFSILRSSGLRTWLPVQTEVAKWMGETKVWRPDENLISNEQIAEIAQKLEPGDILFERREWHLSNVGIPGFWPHLALYVGTAEQRRLFFNVPEVKTWVQANGEDTGDLEKLLAQAEPEAYAQSRKPYRGHAAVILESIAEGVTFTSLEKSAKADSLAVLRPRLSPLAKAVAIFHAFNYAGRPYDYNFDFRTDDALVCSELIYKAYEKNEYSHGLRLPVIQLAGRPVTPPNRIAQLFDETTKTQNCQFDFVLFLDGDEYGRKAVLADETAFRTSWKRPKWHILKKP